jgi:hypothetical protein
MQAIGNNLIHILKSGSTDAKSIQAFHNWIYLFLSFQPSVDENNKWSMVIECWLALYNMKLEGHFAQANEVTPLLAMMEYSSRAATLFESYQNQANFDNSIYK